MLHKILFEYRESLERLLYTMLRTITYYIHGLHEQHKCFLYTRFTRTPRVPGVPVLYTVYTKASSTQSTCFIHSLCESFEFLFYIRFIRDPRVSVLYTVYMSASSSWRNSRNSQGQNRQNTSSKSIQKIIDQKIWIENYFLHTKSVQKISIITESHVALDVHSLSQVHVHKRAPISHWTI